MQPHYPVIMPQCRTRGLGRPIGLALCGQRHRRSAREGPRHQRRAFTPPRQPGWIAQEDTIVMRPYYYRLFRITVHTSAKGAPPGSKIQFGVPESTNPPPSALAHARDRGAPDNMILSMTLMCNSTDALRIQGFKLRPTVKDQGTPRCSLWMSPHLSESYALVLNVAP